MQLKAWHVSLVILLAGAVMSAYAVRVLFVDPVKHGPKIALAVESKALPTPTLAGSPTATIPATALPALPPRQILAPTDRSDCNTIRGTEYRSDTERTWYLANCVKA